MTFSWKSNTKRRVKETLSCMRQQLLNGNIKARRILQFIVSRPITATSRRWIFVFASPDFLAFLKRFFFSVKVFKSPNPNSPTNYGDLHLIRCYSNLKCQWQLIMPRGNWRFVSPRKALLTCEIGNIFTLRLFPFSFLSWSILPSVNINYTFFFINSLKHKFLRWGVFSFHLLAFIWVRRTAV